VVLYLKTCVSLNYISVTIIHEKTTLIIVLSGNNILITVKKSVLTKQRPVVKKVTSGCGLWQPTGGLAAKSIGLVRGSAAIWGTDLHSSDEPSEFSK